MACSVVRVPGSAAEATEEHPRTIASAEIARFIGEHETTLQKLAIEWNCRQELPRESSGPKTGCENSPCLRDRSASLFSRYVAFIVQPHRSDNYLDLVYP
jgi:hypothetical protein